MAEGGGLLNRYTLSRRIEGSNPSVSAIYEKPGERAKFVNEGSLYPMGADTEPYCRSQ